MRPLYRCSVGVGLWVLAACGSDNGGSVEPPPAATTLSMNDGNEQTAAPGTAVATTPSVKVTDANDNPVSGVAVTFAVTSGGGSITGGAVYCWGGTTGAARQRIEYQQQRASRAYPSHRGRGTTVSRAR
jgi:hypothetical protein